MKIPKREAELQDALDVARNALKALREDPNYSRPLAEKMMALTVAEGATQDARKVFQDVRIARLVESGICVMDGGICDDFAPGLVKALERESGWKWDEHGELKASNAASYTKSPFQNALTEIRSHFTLTDPAINAARAAVSAGEDKRERARIALHEFRRTEMRLQDDVSATEQALADYISARARRQAIKPDPSVAEADAQSIHAKNEARRLARQALNAIGADPGGFLARYTREAP